MPSSEQHQSLLFSPPHLLKTQFLVMSESDRPCFILLLCLMHNPIAGPEKEGVRHLGILQGQSSEDNGEAQVEVWHLFQGSALLMIKDLFIFIKF